MITLKTCLVRAILDFAERKPGWKKMHELNGQEVSRAALNKLSAFSLLEWHNCMIRTEQQMRDDEKYLDLLGRIAKKGIDIKTLFEDS